MEWANYFMHMKLLVGKTTWVPSPLFPSFHFCPQRSRVNLQESVFAFASEIYTVYLKIASHSVPQISVVMFKSFDVVMFFFGKIKSFQRRPYSIYTILTILINFQLSDLITSDFQTLIFQLA